MSPPGLFGHRPYDTPMGRLVQGRSTRYASTNGLVVQTLALATIESQSFPTRTTIVDRFQVAPRFRASSRGLSGSASSHGLRCCDELVPEVGMGDAGERPRPFPHGQAGQLG